jgi:hypothetical protein
MHCTDLAETRHAVRKANVPDYRSGKSECDLKKKVATMDDRVLSRKSLTKLLARPELVRARAALILWRKEFPSE